MYKVTVPALITDKHFNKEKTLAEVKRAGADRIALAVERRMNYTFSSPEDLARLKECIEYFNDSGIEVMVWIGESIGHYPSPAEKEDKFKHIKFFDTGYIAPYCPLDTKFRDAVASWVKDIARCGAKMIMFDDDLRLSYRLGLGCCCEMHMDLIQKELGEKITEEELKRKAFDGKRNKYRDAWFKVQAESMYNYARKIRKELDTVNPEVRLGYCSAPSSWDGEGYDAIELAKCLAGNTKPFLRTAGAPYWVQRGWMTTFTLGEITEFSRLQHYWCKDSGVENFAEGDTYPRPRAETPASFLEGMDMVLRADNVGSGNLKYMLDYVSDADYETGYIDASVKNKELYKQIEKHFADKKSIGVRLYNVMHMAENMDLDIEKEDTLQRVQLNLFYPSVRFAVVNSLPSCFEGNGVNILFGENAKYIKEEELKNGCIIDITAAKYLSERLIDVGIENMNNGVNSQIRENFQDSPQEYFVKEGVYTRLLDMDENYDIKIKAGAEVLSELVTGTERKPLVYKYENKQGQRFLVFAFNAEKVRTQNEYFASYARRRQVTGELEWLGRKSVPVTIDGNYPRLYMLMKEDSEGISVGLWNFFEDTAENIRLEINAEYKDIEFINCTGHRDGNGIVLDTELTPYRFAGFELKKI